MTDTTIVLTPSVAGLQGPQTVTANAALFAATDAGRGLSIFQTAQSRVANRAYATGAVFTADYAGTDRVYRVIIPGTTAAASLAGTVPNYDLNAPHFADVNVTDGSCTLTYLGAGTGVYGYGRITAVLSPTQVTVNVDPRGPFPTVAGSLRWRLGDWGPQPRGYPAACRFWQQRLIFAGTTVKPQTLWMSASADFETMATSQPDGTVLDTDAITIALDDDEVNLVRWMASVPRGLVVGMQSGEFLVGPANPYSYVISPTNIRGVRQSGRGSNDVAGLPISGVVVFVQRGGRKLRELQYDFGSDSFLTPDLTQLCDQIAGDHFTDMTYQEEQDGTLWLTNSEGVLVSLTFDREQKVRAPAQHVLGGHYVYQGVDYLRPFVTSVCCVPSADGIGDDLYVCVLRTIGGVSVQTIEVIGAPYRSDIDGDTGGYFVDCGLSYSGPPATVFSGLDHLDGETVAICADGAVRPPQIVIAGSVTIAAPGASEVHIGLPYTSSVTTLPAEVAGQTASTQGALKVLGDVFLRLLETRGGLVGRPGRMTQLQMRPRNAPMSIAEPMFTGDYRVEFPGGVDRDGALTVMQADPLPMTLLAIVEDVVTNA